MGKQKLFSIVTNDEYEFPVVCDILGFQAAVDYLGIALSTAYNYIYSGKWPGKYKIINLGFWDGGEKNEEIVPLTEEERKKKLTAARQQKHFVSSQKVKTYQHEWYQRNREKMLAAAKARYWGKKGAK